LDANKKDVLPLPYLSKLEGNSLIIKYAATKDAGYYECQGVTDQYNVWSKHYTEFTARAILAVLSKFYIIE